MNKIAKILAGLLVALSPLGAMGAEKPLVVTSVRPLALLVEELAGDWLEVKQVLEPGQEPHHLSLSASQRRLLEEADLVIWVGPGLEGFLVKPLAGLDDNRKLSLEAFAEKSGLPGLGDPDFDPHLWMRPPLVKAFYQRLGRELMSRYPERADELVTRLAEVNAEISARLSDIGNRLSPLQDRRYLVEHQAYGHFSRYFGLSPAGALVDVSGKEVGPRSFAGLADTGDVRCLMVEGWPASQRARRMAALLQVRMIAVDPLGEDVAGGEGGFNRYLDSLAGGFEACLTAEPLNKEDSEDAEQEEDPEN